jgi:rhodanese-related sulfurtransferase
MPSGQLIRKARHGDIDELKDKKICSYYSSGYRGNMAAEELAKLGFAAVTIEGGYSAWKEREINIPASKKLNNFRNLQNSVAYSNPIKISRTVNYSCVYNYPLSSRF